MNNKVLRVLLLSLVIFSFIIIISNVYGASIGVSVGYSSITVGGSTTMTISGNDAIGKISISSSNPNVVSVSQSSLWLEGSASITLTTKSVGDATITVSAVDMSDSSGNAFSGSRSVGINVRPVYVDTRSTNNNLASLSLGNDLKLIEEFAKDRFWYGISVPNEITSVEVLATAEDSKANITISGNKDLVVGENFVTIVVTAENESTKTYNIKVVREKDPKDTMTYLKTLEFDGAKLRNEFNKEQYYYMLEDIYGDVESIKVSAIPEVDGAKVEISGNRNLKIGLNVIEILVTSKDESNAQKYRVEVFKKDEVLSLVDVQNEKSFKDILKENWQKILLLILVIIEFIIILVLLIKRKKESNYDYTDRKNVDTSSNLNIELNKNDEKEESSDAITEDTLKYNDIDKFENSRRHRRNI